MFDMDISRFGQLNKAKTGLLVMAAVVAVSGLGSTAAGQRLFAQIGITDAIARTVGAAAAVAENSGNAVQAFLSRSPGERGATDMLKGKIKPVFAESPKASSGPKPTQRALGKVFDEPLQSLAGPLAPAPGVDFLPLDASSASAALPALAMPLPIGAGIFSPVTGGVPSGGGFVGGGGGDGGSGESGGGFIPPAPPPITSAVPEPSTWMLLLIGFAAVGVSMRRAKVRQVSALGRAGPCAAVS
jgi:hypothetical protein